jgi:hypothetical protein
VASHLDNVEHELRLREHEDPMVFSSQHADQLHTNSQFHGVLSASVEVAEGDHLLQLL